MTESKQRQDKEWSALTSKWHQGLAQAHAVVHEINQESGRLFLDWNDSRWKDWTPPAAVPPGIHFGDYRVDLAQLPGGLPRDERLKPGVPTQFPLPALLPFPDRCSLLIKAGEEG